MEIVSVGTFDKIDDVQKRYRTVEAVHYEKSSEGVDRLHSLRIAEDDRRKGSDIVKIMSIDIPPVAVTPGDIVHVDTRGACKGPYNFESSHLSNKTTGNAYIEE